MKKLFIIIIVFVSLQSWSSADDIRDFEIEGVSVGDSLLDFFNKKKINTFMNYDDLPSDMKFRIIEFGSNESLKMKIYDGMQKPAFIFDGRNILDKTALEAIGFKYNSIGR